MSRLAMILSLVVGLCSMTIATEVQSERWLIDWDESFDSGQLPAQWRWLGAEDGYEIIQSTLSLKLSDCQLDDDGEKSLLLLSPMQGFQAAYEVTFDPLKLADGSQAGLVLYADQENFVSIAVQNAEDTSLVIRRVFRGSAGEPLIVPTQGLTNEPFTLRVERDIFRIYLYIKSAALNDWELVTDQARLAGRTIWFGLYGVGNDETITVLKATGFKPKPIDSGVLEVSEVTL